MSDLHIIVNNKVATYLTRDGNIVCGNSDYRIVFTFDSEWDEYTEKVARFIWNDKFIDVIFNGNTVAVPVISHTTALKVGVYAGELRTTTSAEIPCVFSVLCENGAEEAGYEDVNGKIIYRLPVPNEEDEGKYLKVVDGVWVAAPLNPVPVEVATEAEMTALLETAEIGEMYKYTGETTDTYENGAIYIVEEVSE